MTLPEDSTFFKTAQPYIVNTVAAFSKYRDLIVTLVNLKNDRYTTAIKPMVKFFTDRSQALIMLIQYGYLWDAEILIRVMSESTFRIMFISYATDEERTKRIHEFWDDFSEINHLKQSEKVRMASEQYEDKSLFNELEPIRLLKDEEEILRKKWPGSKRRALEQKWSFSEIVREIQTYLKSVSGSEFLLPALWSYGLSSHLIHGDETGIGIIGDRLSRPIDEREKLILAHAARLLSDELSLFALIASSIEHALYGETIRTNHVSDEVNPVIERLNVLTQSFYDEIHFQAGDEIE